MTSQEAALDQRIIEPYGDFIHVRRRRRPVLERPGKLAGGSAPAPADHVVLAFFKETLA